MSINEDKFLTIEGLVTGLYKEKGSKFYAYAYGIKHVEDVDMHLQKLKKEHAKARHFCYAYRIGYDHNNFRTNDDGEPSSTAGKPILGVIDSYNLTDVAVIVVRYFGGTKLGASGLIKAYRSAANEALAQAKVVTKFQTKSIIMEFSYQDLGLIMEHTKGVDALEIKPILKDQPSILLTVKKSTVPLIIKTIKANLLHRDIEDIDDETLLENCTFKIL